MKTKTFNHLILAGVVAGLYSSTETIQCTDLAFQESLETRSTHYEIAVNMDDPDFNKKYPPIPFYKSWNV
ncbi:MAG: hypothetical protein ACSNEK_08545 [Parachlamydiaceae bacterium]